MFLVEKANLSSHFRSTTTKSPHAPKRHHLAAQLFDEKVIHHLKTLDLPQTSSNLTLSWLSSAVSFLSTVHTEAEAQISNLKPKSEAEADDYHALYMDYSLKVLDLCNLISSAVRQLTDRRLLMNYSLRLLNFTDQMPDHEKLNKAKDAVTRSVNNSYITDESVKEKGLRAQAVMEDLSMLLGKLPRGGGDLIRRTFYALGLLTIFVGSVVVAVLFGELDSVKLRVPAEFLWADSVNDLQSRIVDLMKLNCVVVLEVDDLLKQAVVVGDVIQTVVDGGDDGDGDGDGDGRFRLVAGVKELASLTEKFSDGLDGLSNGVNGLFRTVLKARNGRLEV